MRVRAGESAALSYPVWEHVVAARYGQTPEAVRSWPADDFARAIELIGITGRG